MTRSFQQFAIAMERSRHQRNEDERKQRQMPVHIKRTGDAGDRFERLPNDFSAKKAEAIGDQTDVVREPRHEVRVPFERQRLIVESECVPKTVLA